MSNQKLKTDTEWLDSLRNRYPDLFPVDVWVQRGWWPIVERGFAIVDEARTSGLALNPKVDQVKEKFGGLRFYASGQFQTEHEYNYFHGRLAELESEAARTCEFCGAPGERDDSQYWVKTCCEACKAKR